MFMFTCRGPEMYTFTCRTLKCQRMSMFLLVAEFFFSIESSWLVSCKGSRYRFAFLLQLLEHITNITFFSYDIQSLFDLSSKT